jgi:hypothetical protein
MSTHRRLARAIACLMVAAGGLAPARPIVACNACLEDKIAATYDWQVVTSAEHRGHTVVFLALVGPARPGDEALARRIARGVSATPGVDAGTVRVSLAPPAVSFAGDLHRHRVTDLVSSMSEHLEPAGFRLTVVRIGAPGASATSASFTR